MTKLEPSTLDIAKATLLAPAGLDELATQRVFGTILAHKADDADLYFQYNRSEGWTLEEGQVKSGSFSIDQGVGVRVVAGEKTAFAYADDINPEALESAAKVTRAIAADGGTGVAGRALVSTGHSLYAPIDPISQFDDAQKVRILETLERFARRVDPRVKQVIGRLSGEYDVVLVARADGGLGADVRPLVHLAITVIAEQDGRREEGYQGAGGRFGYAYFTEERLAELARAAVRQALVNLEARPAPAGVMSVVLGPGWPGILLHEAIGHGMEADFNRKNTSIYADKIGKPIAKDIVSIVDDGTIDHARGAINVDDEGNAPEKTMLVDKGVLTTYLHDAISAKHYGVKPTGSGRRESFRHSPMPRMRATYMLGGPHEDEEIMKSVKKGIYCTNFTNGQVTIGSGDFTFYVKNGFLIEDGKITKPITDVNLIGNGPKILEKVDMVAKKLEFDEGGWTCGKNGQMVPVGMGISTVKVSEITVGGTKVRSQGKA